MVVISVGSFTCNSYFTRGWSFSSLSFAESLLIDVTPLLDHSGNYE